MQKSALLSNNKSILISVVGPTAIGKTALSIKLAQHFACPIISCDSRQFFKEMSIGTAVPSADELAAAEHHFIQNISIHDSYSVGDFEKQAIKKLTEIFKTNKFAILVGGSGLYVDAVCNGLDVFPTIDKSIREQLILDFENFGINFLQQKLLELDEIYYRKLEIENPQTLQNPQRLMRFVEVCVGTNLPYSSFLQKQQLVRDFDVISIGIDANRTEIYDRINRRVDLMMNNGLLHEVLSLLQFQDLNALQTVGYRELFDYLKDNCTLEFAIDEIKKNTRRFAKRQLTWFKKNENTTWFDFQTDVSDIIDFIDLKP